MRYKVVRSFSGTLHGHYSEGQILDELPEGVDWLKAGLVTPVESAMMSPPKAKGGKALPVTRVMGTKDYKADLSALGIQTAADLAAADVKQLTTIKGVGKVTAQNWIDDARELLT